MNVFVQYGMVMKIKMQINVIQAVSSALVWFQYQSLTSRFSQSVLKSAPRFPRLKRLAVNFSHSTGKNESLSSKHVRCLWCKNLQFLSNDEMVLSSQQAARTTSVYKMASEIAARLQKYKSRWSSAFFEFTSWSNIYSVTGSMELFYWGKWSRLVYNILYCVFHKMLYIYIYFFYRCILQLTLEMLKTLVYPFIYIFPS